MTLNTTEELCSVSSLSCRARTTNKDVRKSDKVCVSQSRNSKVFGLVGTQQGVLAKIASIIDIGAEPNFIRKNVHYVSLTNRIRYGHLPHIQDANKHLLKLPEIVILVAQPASENARVKVFVCKYLADLMILRANFCDKLVQAIQPGEKVVDLKEKPTTPILSNGLRTQRRSHQMSMGIPYGHVTDSEALSSLI